MPPLSPALQPFLSRAARLDSKAAISKVGPPASTGPAFPAIPNTKYQISKMILSQISRSGETRYLGQTLFKFLIPEAMGIRGSLFSATRFGVVCYAAIITRAYS